MDSLFGDDPLDLIVAQLRRYPGWPADDIKDRTFAREILETFPSLDVIAEISAWRIWMMDHEQKKEVRPRARLHRWLRGARGDFGRGQQGKGAGGGRAGTTARPAEAFGSESRSSARW